MIEPDGPGKDLRQAILAAATADVTDLMTSQQITVELRPWADRPGGVEIVVTEHQDVGAFNTVLMSLDNAGYRSHISHSGEPGSPRISIVQTSHLVPEPPIEMTTGADVHEHLGRLVAFHRGRLYEVLGAGLVHVNLVERDVIVPAPRFNLLGQPNPPGTTMTIKAFVDDEYPVSDSPTDPETREKLIGQGHQLMAADLTATWLGSPTFHLHVARRLDETAKAIWRAALTHTSDLVARRDITMDIGVPAEEPSRLEIVVTGRADDVGVAVARVLWGLRDAGYDSFVQGAPPTGPGTVLIHVDRPTEGAR